MRCAKCGTNLSERTERNAEGTVEKTFHCYNCGVVRIPDSEDDVPEGGVENPKVPKVVQRSLNLILWPVIFLAVAAAVYYTLSPIGILLEVFLGRTISLAFSVLKAVTAICAGLYIASKLFSDASRRIDENDW